MSTMRVLLSRALDVLFRRRRDERLTEEVDAHLDLLTHDYIAGGLTPGGPPGGAPRLWRRRSDEGRVSRSAGPSVSGCALPGRPVCRPAAPARSGLRRHGPARAGAGHRHQQHAVHGRERPHAAWPADCGRRARRGDRDRRRSRDGARRVVSRPDRLAERRPQPRRDGGFHERPGHRRRGASGRRAFRGDVRRGSTRSP